MSPIRQAEQLYRADSRNFSAILLDHRYNGVVIDNPDCFALAKAVQLEDNRVVWLVSVAVGKLSELIKHFPWPLPWIAFHRKRSGGRLKVYPLMRFIGHAA